MKITLVCLDASAPFPLQLMGALSCQRRDRIRRLQQEMDKKRSMIAELLMRAELSKALGIDRDRISIAASPFGRPYCVNNPQVFFNVTHSGDYVGIAVDEAPVGIDIEKITRCRAECLRIAERFFAPQERRYLAGFSGDAEFCKAFYTLWTLKESYIKAEGKGLSIPLESFYFVMDNAGRPDIRNADKSYWFYTSAIDKSHWLSVCAWNAAPSVERDIVGERDFIQRLSMAPKYTVR